LSFIVLLLFGQLAKERHQDEAGANADEQTGNELVLPKPDACPEDDGSNKCNAAGLVAARKVRFFVAIGYGLPLRVTVSGTESGFVSLLEHRPSGSRKVVGISKECGREFPPARS
jgi:hypothetical protein